MWAIIISVLFFLFSFSLFAFPLLYSEKGTHLYILKEPWCVAAALLLKINLFLSLGEKSIRLSSISVFPCVKQGNLLKTFLTMMSTGRWCGIWKLKNLHRNLKKELCWWLSKTLRNSDQKRWEMLLQEELQHFSLFSVRWSLLKDGMCNVLCTINRSLVELFLKSWSRFIEVEESCSDDVSARALLDERSISKDQGFEDSIAFFKNPKKKAFESFLTTFQNCMFSNLRNHWLWRK